MKEWFGVWGEVMSKGSYPGGGTVIGPQDVAWFGNGSVTGGQREDAAQIARRRANPLTAEAQRRIDNLRIDVAGLTAGLARLSAEQAVMSAQLQQSQADLTALLSHHGLLETGPTGGLPAPIAGAATTKTTRHQRRKRARAKQIHG